MMRARIPASGTPQQPNIRSLDFGKGVLGKTVLMMLFGGAAWGTGNPLLVVGISCENEAERPRERPGRNGGPMKRGRRHGRSPHSRARAVAGGSNVGRCPTSGRVKVAADYEAYQLWDQRKQAHGWHEPEDLVFGPISKYFLKEIRGLRIKAVFYGLTRYTIC